MACPFIALRKAQRSAYSKSFFLRVLEPLIVTISLWSFLMKRCAMSLSCPLCLTPERMRLASLALRAQMYLGCGKCGSLFRFHPRSHRAAICANKKSESLGEGAFRNKSKQNFKKATLNHTYSLYLGPSPSTDLQPFSTTWNLLDYPLYLCSS